MLDPRCMELLVLCPYLTVYHSSLQTAFFGQRHTDGSAAAPQAVVCVLSLCINQPCCAHPCKDSYRCWWCVCPAFL
jgi:hypothetical protein